MDKVDEARAELALLTDKQRLVLDLLLLHKSSKEIARALEISPYTVDQRIAAARSKLGVGSRGEVARRYLTLREICEETAYGFPHVVTTDVEQQDAPQDQGTGPVYTLADVAVLEHKAPWETPRVPDFGLEALDRRFGISGRILAILGIAAIMALTLLAMVSMAKTLTDMI